MACKMLSKCKLCGLKCKSVVDLVHNMWDKMQNEWCCTLISSKIVGQRPSEAREWPTIWLQISVLQHDMHDILQQNETQCKGVGG